MSSIVLPISTSSKAVYPGLLQILEIGFYIHLESMAYRQHRESSTEKTGFSFYKNFSKVDTLHPVVLLKYNQDKLV